MPLLHGNQPSSLTIAHQALYDAQIQNGSTLDLATAKRKLQSTAGIIFPAGTTFTEVCQKLESYHLIRIEKDRSHMTVLKL